MIKDGKYDFQYLLEIISKLRSENGCPWDREQTHQSLKRNLIEETYEVLEAIDLDDKDRMCEELGDILLQVIFHAQISSEEGHFNIDDIVNRLCEKLIIRHPHVFEGVSALTADEGLKNWEERKKKEKGFANQTEVLKDVPKNLPALMRSFKVQQKAADVGFDWDNIEDVFSKVYEEIDELKEAYSLKNQEEINDELGDVLFSIVNISRVLDVHPEIALGNTIEKFINRFQYIEKEGEKLGYKVHEMTLQQMDDLWNKAKKKI